MRIFVKKNVIYLIILFLTIFVTVFICNFILKKNELKLKQEIKKEILTSFEQNKTKNGIFKDNDCELGYIIYTYEQLINNPIDGRGKGGEIRSVYKKQESEKNLNEFVKEVEKNFSEETPEFLELFNHNKNSIEQLSKNNMQIFCPEEECDREKSDSNVSPFVMSNKIGAENNFIEVELKYLKELLDSYCHFHQDNNACVKMVFSKIK